MKQALKQQGFESLGRKQTEWKAWMEREKVSLGEIAPVSYTHLDVYKRQILCVERASAYVSAQPEMLEGAEIFPYSADLEPIYLHDKRTANAGHFAGLSGGRLRLETGTGVPCEGVPAWRAGGTGAAARLYSGQQRGEAAA